MRNFLIVVLAGLLLYWFFLRDASRSPRVRPAFSRAVEEDPFPYEMKFATLLDTTYLPAVLRCIRDARGSIEISMFLAQDPNGPSAEILEALISASERGVRVRAIFENRVSSNRIWSAILNERGIDARLDRDDVKLHDKALLIDGALLIAGSHNWTNAALVKNREASLMIKAESPAFHLWHKRFESAFNSGERIRDATVPWRAPSRPTFAPAMRLPRLKSGRGRIAFDDDYVKASEQIIKLMSRELNAAIYFVSVRSIDGDGPLSRFAQTLFDKVKSGNGCRVILDQMNIDEDELGNKENDVSISYLRRHRVKVDYDPPDITHHVKAVVIDRRYTLMGSHNWTTSSTRFNRETSVLIDSPELAREMDAYLSSLMRNLRKEPSTAAEREARWVPMEDLITVR